MGQRAALREFLRSRRARITPELAGLRPGPGRRRVPGLRREELAELAGISVDYYVRFEQGRCPNVSDAVLDAVARVLGLSPAERAYLHVVARDRHDRSSELPQPAGAALRSLLATISAPAFALGRRVDVVATNEPARRLFDGLDRCGNYVRWLLLDANSRLVCVDWPTATREAIALLRRDAACHPTDHELRALIDTLRTESASFQRTWDQHEVDVPAGGPRRYRRPSGEEIVLTRTQLAVPDDPDQSLFVFMYAADTRAAPTVERCVPLHAPAYPANAWQPAIAAA